MRAPEHRQIRVDIEERFSRDLVRDVADGRASLGVCWDSVEFAGLEHRPYREDDLALAVPAKHALAKRTRLRFEQTLGYEHVGLPPSTAVHTMLQRAAARVGKPLVYRAIVSSFDAALRVVAADLGISVIPREIARRYGRGGEVKVVTLTDPWAPRRFALCWRREGALQPAARRLAEFLAARGAR
jgi:DNA-binding transcriptional LysR family regulator